MRIDRIASSAGVLAHDPTGLAPFLHESGLVDDEHTARFVPEMREHIVPQPAQRAPGACPVGIPARRPHETLDALWIGVADRLRELPAMLALDVTEQAEQVAP